ncbi:MAG: UDP-N-acetylmuramoyl-tripeptide--D-alanyl-D-alanine ligase [marine benthic group bacterium]|nr:UDP-N-acetylmuramoyl-tripeptide--D-alanyl-D-alanine ligase [Gemmatimonadota bacterium]
MAARFTASEVCQVLGLPAGERGRDFSSISTDTRDLQPGALFVALRGDRFDGAEFIDLAERLGAAGAVVSAGSDHAEVGFPVFTVPDTTAALGDLARHHRRRCGARVVGVTGSSGKTTVKEMLAHAVGSERRVHATRGNLNNQVGLPLSILAAEQDADVWVLELGTSEPGEIERLTSIAEPDDAVITTVGPAHLEGLGDVAGVLEEKLDLFRGASDSGCAVVGELPEELPKRAREVRGDVVTAGLGSGSDFRPSEWSVSPEQACFTLAGVDYSVPVGGEHHLRDALIAAAAATGLGVSPAGVARGLAEYRPVGLRGALIQVDHLTVVADCYNANPESFAAAIRYCSDAFPGRRLAAVVGSMLELGEAESAAHAEVAADLVRAGFTFVLALGAFQPAFRTLSLPRGVRVLNPATVQDAADDLAGELKGDEVLLVKASRGMRLEGVIDSLTGGDA